MRPSKGIQKTRDVERKAEDSRLLEPAGVWAEHGVMQRQENHMPYCRATELNIRTESDP